MTQLVECKVRAGGREAGVVSYNFPHPCSSSRSDNEEVDVLRTKDDHTNRLNRNGKI